MHRSIVFLMGVSSFAISGSAWAQEQGVPPENSEQAETTAAPPNQEQRDVIVVTATKRASTVQDVPFSINAQTQQDIERSHAQNIEDISRSVAGLTVQNQGPGQSQVSIRGVSAGEIVRDQPGVKEQVGVYLDETAISLSLFTPDLDLFDLNRVETLRGPQGTLFGSGSVGGTLRYITNAPRLGRYEGQVEGGVSVAKGGDIGYDMKGAVNIPLSTTAAFRGVAYFSHFPGFIDSVGPYSRKNVNDGKRYGGRASILFQPTPELKIVPRVVWQRVQAGGFNREDNYILYENQFTTGSAGSDLGERTVYLKIPEEFKDRTSIYDLTASYDFGGAEVTSVSSYVNRDILVSRDASALTGSITIDPFVRRFGGDPSAANLASNLHDTTKLKQFTQEVRLASTGSGPFEWVIGAYYGNVDRKYFQRLPTPGYDAFTDATLGAGTSAAVDNGFGLTDNPYHADLPYKDRQKALFGEASYKLGEFKLTAGGRAYSFKETRRFHSGGVFSDLNDQTDKTSSKGFNPRAIVSWQPNRSISVNVQAAKGFRLGGVNDPLNRPLCSGSDIDTFGNSQTYKDETLWNYEAGFKYSKRNVTFNAAAFYNDIRNLQVTLTAGSCSSRVVFNVPKAHSKGLEAELNVQPVAGLDIGFAGSLLDSKFDSTVTDASNVVLGGIRDGNRLPVVPKYQLAVTAGYTAGLTSSSDWYVNGSVQRIGNRFTQPSDQEDSLLQAIPGPIGGNGAIFYDPATNAWGERTINYGPFTLPAYSLVNLSAGVKWDEGLEISAYVKNLLDADPKLSLDRERGLRARVGYNVGSPRVIGLTVRKSFGR